jgi:DNA-binding MarR family transcriptional regulator
VRVRIGDIEIDGPVVRIGGQPTPQVYVPQELVLQAPPPAPARPDPFMALPVRGRVLIQLGAVLLLAGIVLFAVAPPASILAFLLHVLPLTVGGGSLGLGVIKQLEEGRQRQAARLLGEAEIAPHVERIRAALSEPRPEQTVEWIATSLQLPEATVVRALDRLRKQGDIEEELNIDNGEWYYFARPRDTDSVRRDLEARMAALETRRTE